MNETDKTVLANGGSKATNGFLHRAQEKVSAAKRAPAGNTKREATEEKKAKALSKELDKLYSAEFFTPLMRAPADIMLAISGDRIWKMEEKEATVLGGSAATAARYFMEMHPKWVALAIFCSTITASYGSRTMMYMRKKSDSKQEKSTNGDSKTT